jgi:hypothetical protein
MDEVTTWFATPHHLVELFLNFDMDRKLVSQWNIFGSMCEAVAGLAETCMTPGPKAHSTSHAMEEYEHKATMHLRALVCATQIAKALMDASGHAHLQAMDAHSTSRSGDIVWEKEDVVVVQQPEARPNALHRRSRSGSVKYRREMHKQNEGLLAQALKIFREKSLKKAVQFLVANNFMSDTPQEVASFLRLYSHFLDPVAIGDFLGEGGTAADEHYWAQIRFRYTRAISFTEMSLENALRHFFTSAGFRAPGEAQKIDRLLIAFAKCFYDDNKGTPVCPFTNPDTPYVLSYAIIILNTDLNRANVDTKKKKRRMTKDEFINNLRGVDSESRDLDREYLSRIYDSIQTRPIEIALQEQSTHHKETPDKPVDELTEQVRGLVPRM